MIAFFKQMLSGTDGKPSSKRLAVLWVAIPIWSFIHYMAFTHETMREERGTLIMYDFLIIISGLGILVHENLRGKKIEEEIKIDK